MVLDSGSDNWHAGFRRSAVVGDDEPILRGGAVTGAQPGNKRYHRIKYGHSSSIKAREGRFERLYGNARFRRSHLLHRSQALAMDTVGFVSAAAVFRYVVASSNWQSGLAVAALVYRLGRCADPRLVDRRRSEQPAGTSCAATRTGPLLSNSYLPCCAAALCEPHRRRLVGGYAQP